MLKVSRILRAAFLSPWVHYWMSPTGELINAGEDHCTWAIYHLTEEEGFSGTARQAAQELLSRGWIRLGDLAGGVYVNAEKFQDRNLFGKVQTFVEENAVTKNVTLDIGPIRSSRHAFIPVEDFITASSPTDLLRLI